MVEKYFEYGYSMNFILIHICLITSLHRIPRKLLGYGSLSRGVQVVQKFNWRALRIASIISLCYKGNCVPILPRCMKLPLNTNAALWKKFCDILTNGNIFLWKVVFDTGKESLGSKLTFQTIYHHLVPPVRRSNCYTLNISTRPYSKPSYRYEYWMSITEWH